MAGPTVCVIIATIRTLGEGDGTQRLSTNQDPHILPLRPDNLPTLSVSLLLHC